MKSKEPIDQNPSSDYENSLQNQSI